MECTIPVSRNIIAAVTNLYAIMILLQNQCSDIWGTRFANTLRIFGGSDIELHIMVQCKHFERVCEE
ncbi:hypothetical protein WS68_00775 [Burkholderia sp. TSV86]|nr:hypothetical protein WS68_00775 [Burkholderia sp. TSV86]